MQIKLHAVAAAALVALALAADAGASLLLTNTLTATENFNGLPATGSNTLNGNIGVTNPLTGSTFDGSKVATGNSNITLSIFANNGATGTGAIYSYGTGSASDRALGLLASNSTTAAFGVQIVNNSGQTLTGITLSGFSESWRAGDTVAGVLTASYALGGGGSVTATNYLNPASDPNFTAIASLNLVGPTPASPAAALDGNAVANRKAVAGTVTASIAPGQSIFFKWVDFKDPSSDSGIALDDLTVTGLVTTAPEPSSLALLGVAGLGLLRRRRA